VLAGWSLIDTGRPTDSSILADFGVLSGGISMENLNVIITWLSLFAVIISMAIASQNSNTPNSEGQLTVAGNTVQIQHAYAMAQPGFFDENKEDILLIVTNIPLTDKAIEDRWQRNTLVSEATLQTVEVTINSEQQPISVSVKHPAFQASPSGSSTNYILELKTFNEKIVEGRMYCKTEMEFFDTTYLFDFTFKAEIRRKKELPPLTEAEKETAANSPQAAVYLTFVEAVNTGDVNTLKKVLAADVARELDGPEGKEMLEFMQITNPSKAEFHRITVEGDGATLMLGAQDEGHDLKGAIEFIREGDQWKIMLSSWEEK
jgi:hypothetical protein